MQLLRNLGRLSQISSLRLEHHVNFDVAGDYVSKLSRLSQLTELSLSLRGDERGDTHDAWSRPCLSGEEQVVLAVSMMHKLRRLEASIRGHDLHAPGVRFYPFKLAQELCGLTELTELESISVPSLYNRTNMDQFFSWSRQDFPLCAWARNASLLARLTQLNLSGNEFGLFSRGLEHLMHVLHKVPAMQSLDISECALGDTGLVQFASAIPKMAGLTRLSLASNEATHEGVFPVLEALIKMKIKGLLRLEELDISDNCIPEKHRDGLETLLGALGIKVEYRQDRCTPEDFADERLCTCLPALRLVHCLGQLVLAHQWP